MKDSILLRDRDSTSILLKEQCTDDETGSFISIDKGMVFHKAVRIGCREVKKVALRIMVKLLRPGQSRLQQPFITNASGSTES